MIWNVNFPLHEEIILIDEYLYAGAPPKVSIYDDTRVLLKHIDSLNFA